MLFKGKAAGEGSVGVGYCDLSEFISFFQETKEIQWVLGANTLTKHLISSESSLMKTCHLTQNIAI